jgi:RHS repeat-associated protein
MQKTTYNRSGLAPANVTHTWDAAGNRSVRDGGTLLTYSYDAGNAISGYVSVSGHGTYSRDENGNLIGTAAYNTSGTLTRLATLTYDGDNRVLVQNSVSATGAVQTFTYDGDGVRRSEVDGATTSNFIWDGNNLLQERNASQTLVAQYTNWPGVWGQLISQRRGSTTTWYNADNQMNVRTLTNSVRTVTDRYQYEAFGDELSASGSSANPFRFGGNVGYYRDFAETYYVRQRMYWGALAQWITRDPIGFDGGDWNLYRYVGDNPVGNVDPNGTAVAILIIGGIAVGIVVVGTVSHLTNKDTKPIPKSDLPKLAQLLGMMDHCGLKFLHNYLQFGGLKVLDNFGTAETRKGIGYVGNITVLNPQFFTTNLGNDRLQTLIHEGLHAYCGAITTGRGDADDPKSPHGRVERWARFLTAQCRQRRICNQLPDNICAVVRRGDPPIYPGGGISSW